MKKFISKVVGFCLALVCVLPLFGCEDDSKFYEQTNTKFEQFVSDICENVSYTNGINHGETVNTIISNTKSGTYSATSEQEEDLESYVQLTEIYDRIFVSSFKFLSPFRSILSVVPTKTSGDVKNKYKNFEQALEDATNGVKSFSEKNKQLSSKIGGTKLDNAVSPLSLQAVKEYKRDYISVTNKMVDVCDKLLEICENYIYPNYSTYIKDGEYITLTQTQITNQINIYVLKGSIQTLQSAITYLNAFNGEYKLLSGDYLVATLNKYISVDLTQSSKQLNDDELKAKVKYLQLWLNTDNAFLGEISSFEQSLAKIDFKKLISYYDFDYEKYLNDFADQKVYVQTINTFINNSVSYLYDATAKLFWK